MSELSDRLSEAAQGKTLDAIVELTHKVGQPLGKGTIHRVMTGQHGAVKQSTLQALADALQLDVRELRVLAGKPAGELGPYKPTEAAASLTKDQRDAIDRMIEAFVKGGSSDSGQDEAQKMSRSMQAADDELARRRREVEELRPLESVASTPSDEERARRKAEDESVAHIDDENQDSGDWEE